MKIRSKKEIWKRGKNRNRKGWERGECHFRVLKDGTTEVIFCKCF
jgi:hypothetical protein